MLNYSFPVEIPASNGGSGDKVYDVFGLNGLYILDSDGMLEKVQNDEKIGTSFTIVAGVETMMDFIFE